MIWRTIVGRVLIVQSVKSYKSNTKYTTYGAEMDYPSGSHEFISLDLCVMFGESLSCCTFSFGHCVVCPSSFGHCVVCPSSFGHCVVCPSFGHCVVCPSSFGHCVVCPSSFSHCVVCPSSIYGVCLPLWYLQTLLADIDLIKTTFKWLFLHSSFCHDRYNTANINGFAELSLFSHHVNEIWPCSTLCCVK